MRNLAIRLVLWLCRVFDIVPLDEARKHMGADKVQRAERWQVFATEAGGLFDMIEAQRVAAFEAYADAPPSDHDTKEHLAMQDRAWRQLRARVDNIIATGKIERANAEAKERAALKVVNNF